MDASADASPIVTAPRRHGRRLAVASWLFLVVAMIVAMVVVGGATRLTHSGLSITEWKPIHGVIPPLNDAEWQEEFQKYQQIPEYQQLNRGMSLEEFKPLFWWEWGHRLLGRVIGAVVLLPLIGFWVAGWLPRALKPQLIALFILGGLQGAIGWWMVASGLSVRTDVSQYRLATHLTFACVILAYTVWLARGLLATWRWTTPGVRIMAGLIVAMAFAQIFLGGLVAGTDAGLTFNTWPLMDGTFVPDGLLAQEPAWRNFFENVATVQFDHRIGAYLLLAVTFIHAIQARGTMVRRSALILFFVVLGQAALGVLTLIHAVPLPLGLLHQLGAVIVLIAAVMHLRAMFAPVSNEGG
jgi:cytochrome c oxidase assembly protein subunit 15